MADGARLNNFQFHAGTFSRMADNSQLYGLSRLEVYNLRLQAHQWMPKKYVHPNSMSNILNYNPQGYNNIYLEFLGD